MKLRQFVDVFRKSLDINRRIRAAFDEGEHVCPSCGHPEPLAPLPALTVRTCPKCGAQSLVPYLLDAYLVYEPIGAGGVSSVYKAAHREHRQTVYAVKLLRADRAVDQAVLDDFLIEAEVHHAVSPHPGIARFIELGHVNGEHFHVMEYVSGETVKHRVEESGRIPEPLARRWIAEFTTTLRHIHDHGFLYRDISPGNLLIRGDNSICLIDFGLALPLDQADQPGSGREVVGTPEYLPPERIEHLGEDERSTVYSLGMLLFYLLKGEPLIKGHSNARAALQHVSAVRVAFNERMLPPDSSPGLVKLIGTMIKVDPADRLPSLEAVEKALAALPAP
jgi:serine/threonine-protein kinase